VAIRSGLAVRGLAKLIHFLDRGLLMELQMVLVLQISFSEKVSNMWGAVASLFISYCIFCFVLVSLSIYSFFAFLKFEFLISSIF